VSNEHALRYRDRFIADQRQPQAIDWAIAESVPQSTLRILPELSRLFCDGDEFMDEFAADFDARVYVTFRAGRNPSKRNAH
jgi:hypothetical protein